MRMYGDYKLFRVMIMMDEWLDQRFRAEGGERTDR